MRIRRYRKGEKINMVYIVREGAIPVKTIRTYQVEREYPNFVQCTYKTENGHTFRACFTRQEIEQQRIN